MVLFKIKKAVQAKKKKFLIKRLAVAEEKAQKRFILEQRDKELKAVKKAIKQQKSTNITPSKVKKVKAKFAALKEVGRGLGVGFVQATKTVKALQKGAKKLQKKKAVKRKVKRKVKKAVKRKVKRKIKKAVKRKVRRAVRKTKRRKR